jgi:hypothetical protein
VTLNLHINRLIVDNVWVLPNARPIFEAAVSAELTRLLAVGGAYARMTSATSSYLVRGSSIAVNEAHKPARLGCQVAGAVYRGIVE